MRLYSYWRSSCSYRVRIALALKGIEAELHPVHLVADGGQQRASEYTAINPMQQVPALVLADGTTLVQSLPIMEYLEEVFPQPPLLPADPIARARVRALAEVVNSGIQPVQNLSVLERVDELGGSKWEWARHFIGRGLAALEATAQATSGRFLVGDAPTIADACLVPQLYNARRFELDLSLYPRLSAVDAECAMLEAFQVAHPDRQPDAPEDSAP